MGGGEQWGWLEWFEWHSLIEHFTPGVDYTWGAVGHGRGLARDHGLLTNSSTKK